ncbi:MAG: TetR/AcrR family transcriptional regulator [Alphaproteobacteria bacterium]|jgi:AcrR family transcriptional regulator
MTETKADAEKPRRRLSPAERERQIVDGAIAFFAEAGLSGQTRELAQRLGITQPLIYRYFPTKQDLIDRVFEEVFVGRWKPEWSALVTDRSQPLRERLIAFYRDYVADVFSYEWIRIYMFAGLAGEDLNQRYIALLEEGLLAPLCRELRAESGAAIPGDTPVDNRELEAAWHIHAAVFYYVVRKHIYSTPVDDDVEEFIADAVDRTLTGTLKQLRGRYTRD